MDQQKIDEFGVMQPDQDFNPSYVNLPVYLKGYKDKATDVVFFSQYGVLIEALNNYKEEVKNKPDNPYRETELGLVGELIDQLNYNVQEWAAMASQSIRSLGLTSTVAP